VTAAIDEAGDAPDSVEDPRESYIRQLRTIRTAAHSLVDALVAEGVDTFFGVPGGPVSPVCQAVLDSPDARFVESRHETAAAFAAASYYRTCGHVAAVVVTAGPGITNAVTGIASAHLSRVPLIVIAGDVAWATTGRRLLQDSGLEGLDADHLLAKVTRATVRVARPESMAAQAIAALTAATEPHAEGPALLIVPMDYARSQVSDVQPVDRARPRVEWTVPPESVATAAEWLAEAERPLVVLGNGCRGHESVVRGLLDAVNVPFVTTPQAKGVVSERHPRSLRSGGMAASMWARAYCEEGVDVGLVLGTDLDDVATGPTRYVSEGGRLVHVDLDARVFDRNVPTALPVEAELGAFCAALRTHVSGRGLINLNGPRLAKATKSASPFDDASEVQPSAAPIPPQAAVLELERAMPEAHFVTDIGEHMLFALHYLTSEPGRFHIDLALGSMGSGIAGAIGVALGDPEHSVVCICGDGGMQMAGAELLLAADLGLPIVYAIFNDARYNMVFHGMKQLYGRGAAWETPWVDFAQWGRAMGVPSLRVNRPDEINADTIERLHSAGPGPVVLDIRIDRDVRIRGGGRVEALQQMSVGEVAR